MSFIRFLFSLPPPQLPAVVPVVPANVYVAEDGVTYYVAEDGATFYVQEV